MTDAGVIIKTVNFKEIAGSNFWVSLFMTDAFSNQEPKIGVARIQVTGSLCGEKSDGPATAIPAHDCKGEYLKTKQIAFF